MRPFYGMRDQINVLVDFDSFDLGFDVIVVLFVVLVVEFPSNKKKSNQLIKCKLYLV